MKKEIKIRHIVEKLDQAVCDAFDEIYAVIVDCDYEETYTEKGVKICNSFDSYDITDLKLYSNFEKKLRALATFCHIHNIEIT